MTALSEIRFGITEHLEGAIDARSIEIFGAATTLVKAADQFGIRYAWFAEHHAHAHRGHCPTPLMFALHLASQTQQISLGTAVICLNHHRPIDVAEQVAVADLLSGGRLAVGFGSGSTPAESALFGVSDMSESRRHAEYAAALLEIETWWGDADREGAQTAHFLPRPLASLPQRCWTAVNSIGAATIAGERGLNVLFSHLRTPAQYATYTRAYRAAGGRGLIAANRPLIVCATEGEARDQAEIAVRSLWRRFRDEGKIAADAHEPASVEAASGHPLNFISGTPDRVAAQIATLYAASPFDVLNVEVTWQGLTSEASLETIRLLVEEVTPRLGYCRVAADRVL